MVNSFTAVDIETTGLNIHTEKIIEVGALKIRNGNMEDRLSAFIHIDGPVPEKITALTGITSNMLSTAQDEETVLNKLYDFIREDVLLGHNILFDYSFLKKYYAGKNKKFSRKGVDTLAISRVFHPKLDSRSLAGMCDYYHIVNENAHRALDDAKAAAELYFKLAEQFYPSDEKPFRPQELLYRIKKEEPITRKQKNYLRDLLKCHKIKEQSILDGKASLDCFTKSEASRKIDNILFQYGRIL